MAALGFWYKDALNVLLSYYVGDRASDVRLCWELAGEAGPNRGTRIRPTALKTDELVFYPSRVSKRREFRSQTAAWPKSCKSSPASGLALFVGQKPQVQNVT